MKTKRLLALAMAGAMMTGAFATAMPVLADDGKTATTTVSLTVKNNSYTMQVPARTELAADGSITALDGGVKITSDNDIESDYAINVTASSANDWKLKASGRSTEISYVLYSDKDGTIEMSGKGAKDGYKLDAEDSDNNKSTIAAKGLWYTADEVNKSECQKDVYAKITDTDKAQNAESGDYEDVITFTAKVGKTVVAKISSSEYHPDYLSKTHYCTVLDGTCWDNILTNDYTMDGSLTSWVGDVAIYNDGISYPIYCYENNWWCPVSSWTNVTVRSINYEVGH